VFEAYELLVISHAWLFYFIDFVLAFQLLGFSQVGDCFQVIFGVLTSQYLDWTTYYLNDWRIYGTNRSKGFMPKCSNWLLVALPMFIFMGLMRRRYTRCR